MKKFLAILVATALLPLQSYAGWTDSFWFEPTALCLAGAGAGYATANNGEEGQNAAIGCAAGALIGYFVNNHYEDKFTKNAQKEINDLNKIILEMEAQQAQRVLKGEDETIGLRVRQMIPGKKLPDGSVTAPTFREQLILPSEGVRIGE